MILPPGDGGAIDGKQDVIVCNTQVGVWEVELEVPHWLFGTGIQHLIFCEMILFFAGNCFFGVLLCVSFSLPVTSFSGVGEREQRMVPWAEAILP